MGHRLNWRVVAATVAGTAHVERGRGCEDHCLARVQRNVGGEPVLSIFVADGAGGAACGGTGAALAVQTADALLGALLRHEVWRLDATLAAEVLQAVRLDLYDAAAAQQRLPRDYACTLIGLVSTPTASLAMQIGDGGLVLDTGAGLEVPIAPMIGEYANSTRFVTDADAPVRWTHRFYPAPVQRAAAFSDGLQGLALDLATLQPHAPLFDGLFAALTSAPPEQNELLPEALARFLDSEQVNARTDDDKALALALALP